MFKGYIVKLSLFMFLLFPVICLAIDVPVYNVKTGEVNSLPQEDLGPEMVRVRLEGEIFWIDSNDLNPSKYQHPVFEGDRKKRVQTILTKLEEVYPQTYEEWEDGFRRDTNPDNEISIWERITSVYRKHSDNVNSLELKKEIFRVALICSYSTPDVVLSQAGIEKLKKSDAEKIIRDFYIDKT
jgi:hypothetical protein|tara:strand:+ start:1778 stop:2326 length:549 start_codon:yes stop_codon:yes gene_type:complete